MKYFIIKTDSDYETSPQIVNWTGIIDKRFIQMGKSYQLPQRTLFHIRSNPDTVFTDVVSFPFFLVSQIVKDTMNLYEAHIIYKEVILLDGNNGSCGLYHLPILQKIDCLSSESELNLDKSVIKKAVLKTDLIGEASIFALEGVTSTYVVARLDLVESILRRGVRGIGLTEVGTIGINKNFNGEQVV